MQQYLEAGKVVTTHGVRGEMKLELWCDGVDFLKKVGRLYPSAQGGKAYKILSIRPQGQMALLQLEGVSDMDAARALRSVLFGWWAGQKPPGTRMWHPGALHGLSGRLPMGYHLRRQNKKSPNQHAPRSAEHAAQAQWLRLKSMFKYCSRLHRLQYGNPRTHPSGGRRISRIIRHCGHSTQTSVPSFTNSLP